MIRKLSQSIGRLIAGRPRQEPHDNGEPDSAGEAESFDARSREYYSTVDSGRRAQSAIYQSLFLKEMLRKLLPYEASGNESFDQVAVEEATRMLMTLLLSTLKGMAIEFNALIEEIDALSPLRITIVDVKEVKEIATPGSTAEIEFLRGRASTKSFSLSMRGSRGRIEIFLVPVSELFLLSQSETPIRLKNVVQLYDRTTPDGIWTIDGLPADPDELYYLVRTLFKNLILVSWHGLRQELVGSSVLLSLEGTALREAVRELLFAEQNMAQKIVSQQEEIQNRIARDLHDAVIQDIMSIERLLGSGKPESVEESISGLDKICHRLREICQDLAPRDLIDWGLETVVEDMLERVGERTGADCSFVSDTELPELPYPVQLHIFRIVQECLNNIEKYACASRVMVRIDAPDGRMLVTIKDNGKGFTPHESEPRKAREGGMGITGIKERAEMIRCFYPAWIKIESEPEKGSTTILEIQIADTD